ncbi:MAG: peptidyl-prolyl cis-trans isomerase [Actinomycetes bacterium]
MGIVRRLLLPVLATVVVTVALGFAVGVGSPSNAAMVNGHPLSQSQVEHDLAAVAASPNYLCYLNASTLVRTSGQAGLGPVNGVAPGSYSRGFVTNFLDTEITNVLIGQRLRTLGLPAPGRAELAVARQDLLGSMDSTISQVASSQYACTGTASTILEAMPRAFQDRQVLAQAQSEALLAKVGGVGLDATSLKNYFESHPKSFDVICLSGILVADQATAARVKTAIQQGADFATEAKAESQDASKEKGGDLGCFSPASPQYQSVQHDVGVLAVGATTDPLPSGSGAFVLLKVTDRRASEFGPLESIVRRTVLADDAKRAQDAAKNLVVSASVTVNPTYGTWHVSATSAGITPPGTPAAGQTPNAKANQVGAPSVLPTSPTPG